VRVRNTGYKSHLQLVLFENIVEHWCTFCSLWVMNVRRSHHSNHYSYCEFQNGQQLLLSNNLILIREQSLVLNLNTFVLNLYMPRYVHMHIHSMYTHTYIYTYVHTYVNIYMRTYTHTHTHMHTHTHNTYMHTFINTYTDTHIHIHTYIHIYTHT